MLCSLGWRFPNEPYLFCVLSFDHGPEEVAVFHIQLRRNGRDTGAIGPYAHKADAERDAREIVIRLSQDAEAVVQKVTVGGTKYRPPHVEGGKAHEPKAPAQHEAPVPEWKKHAKQTIAPAPPKPPKGGGGLMDWFDDDAGSGGEKWEPVNKGKHAPKAPYVAPPPREAYGTVVIDPMGRVLLREPSNHYDGYVWTFPKGGADPGETGEQVALRETEEETGWKVELVGLLPGEWKGGTSINRYYLARPVEDTGTTDKETWTVKFVPYVEAIKHIAQTKNDKGRTRDLEVLDAGYAEWSKLTGKPLYNPRPRPLAR